MTTEDSLQLTPLFEGGGEVWLPLLKPVIEKHAAASDFIGPKRAKTVVPLRELTFQALKPNPPSKWRVVIFGQNPYPRVESATGIAMFDNAFADWNEPQFAKVTSIRCIIKAGCISKHKIEKATSTADIRKLLAKHSVVSPAQWFQAMLAQGVLLLNAALTASSDESVSTSKHTSFWKPVVEAIVEEILKARAADKGSKEGVVFAWWGAHAKNLRAMVEKLQTKYPDVPVKHVDHCNPAAMGDAFCNGDHFGDINRALQSLKMKPVDWLPVEGWNAGAQHDQQETARLGDFIEKTRELHKLYLDRLQGVGDEVMAEMGAITGVLALPLPTLADAMAPLLKLHPGLAHYVRTGETFAQKTKHEQLSTHEVAALYLYTTESVLYKQLNATLRDPDRNKSTPWLGYLRLFLSAMGKLTAVSDSLWRGVGKDLRKDYPVGTFVTWWGVSSCTPKLAVAKGFLGSKGKRMLFEVTPATAVSIKAFSAFTGEEEFVLAPGTKLHVVSVKTATDGLCHVKLAEVAEQRMVS